MHFIHRGMVGMLLAMIMSLPTSAVAANNFPAEQKFAGYSMSLNGKGIRTKLFFNLYTAGLYLQKPSNDANAILNGTMPLALRMEITSAMITSETMESAVRDGFKQSAGAQLANLQPRIEQLIKIFKEKINKGDIYDFIYKPQSVIVQKNGKSAGTIQGADFMKAFYAIWLGDKPVQPNLKDQLLGEAQ
ncbi:MAG: chalcone isomerase family protein [Thiolinea sp.]